MLKRSAVGLAICQALTLLGGYSRSTYAANITVDSFTDDGTGGCELREAVASANMDDAMGNGCAEGAGSDNILFDAALTGMAINLQSSLSVNSDITIDGSAAPGLALSGGGSTYHARIEMNQRLTLSNLIVRDGYRSNGGGSVVMSGSTYLRTVDTIFSGNSAGATGGGGSVYASVGSTLICDSSRFENGSAQTGGALRIRGATTTIDGCTFDSLSATASGAISIEDYATVTVTDSTFSGNSAQYSAGAIGNISGDLTISNSSILNNRAQDAAGILTFTTFDGDGLTISGNTATREGGGILSLASTFSLTNSTLANNQAAYGAGIARYIANPGVQSSTFSGNSATDTGGAIHCNNPCAITNSTISGNVADNGGSAITSTGAGGDVQISFSTIYNNGASGSILAEAYTNCTLDPVYGPICTSGGGASVLLESTVVAGMGPDCTTQTAGYGMYSSTINATDSHFLDMTCDGVADGSPGLDPALADNGGSTLTHAVYLGSPLRDAGPAVGCPVTDQRGVARPLESDGAGVAACEIGALEVPIDMVPVDLLQFDVE